MCYVIYPIISPDLEFWRPTNCSLQYDRTDRKCTGLNTRFSPKLSKQVLKSFNKAHITKAFRFQLENLNLCHEIQRHKTVTSNLCNEPVHTLHSQHVHQGPILNTQSSSSFYHMIDNKLCESLTRIHTTDTGARQRCTRVGSA